MPLTQRVRDLDGKPVCIVTADGLRRPATLRVAGTDPEGSDAGKCSIELWYEGGMDDEWTDAGKPAPVTATIDTQPEFLTPAAVDSLEGSDYGRLVLQL